jgi:hypothetical protein
MVATRFGYNGIALFLVPGIARSYLTSFYCRPRGLSVRSGDRGVVTPACHRETHQHFQTFLKEMACTVEPSLRYGKGDAQLFSGLLRRKLVNFTQEVNISIARMKPR